MKLHKHFLPNDLEQASKEFHAVKDCMNLVTEQIKDGDIKQAEISAYNMLLSLKEMSKLAAKKTNQNKQMQYLKRLSAMGVNAQIVRVMKHE